MDHVSVPSSGDYQFLPKNAITEWTASSFPSPHPGIINFFAEVKTGMKAGRGFRPLIRGLSISSAFSIRVPQTGHVSVPSSGDYQFLLTKAILLIDEIEFPSPHPGIINFFKPLEYEGVRYERFPSPHPGIINFFTFTGITSMRN